MGGSGVLKMVRTTQMPKSVQSDIAQEAVGEALLQHYNVGIHNPWYEHGYSNQETYNRRRLPWAGKSYVVDENGDVSGPNSKDLPENLKQAWANLASEARDVLDGEEFESFDEHYTTLKQMEPGQITD